MKFDINNVFEELNKIYKLNESYKPIKLVTSTGITCEVADYDIDAKMYAYELIEVYKDNYRIFAECSINLDSDDYDYDYADEVLDHVDVGDLAADFEIDRFIDENEVQLSEDEVKQRFNLDEPGFLELKNTICKVAGKHAKDYIEDKIDNDSDYWPEPEEYEPDYDDYY